MTSRLSFVAGDYSTVTVLDIGLLIHFVFPYLPICLGE